MEILYSDDRVIVCVKPAGVLSTDEPGGAPEALREALGEPDAPIRSVHRLDRVVGGVMVYARTRRAAADLSGQIRSGSFEKTYLAVLCGRPEAAEGELRDWLRRDTAGRKTYVVPPGSADAQEAVLDYKMLETAYGSSLVSVRLQTGRTHQIRCQFASRGCPILGDVKYGGPATDGPIALWSHAIAFDHPRTGERLSFSAPPPTRSPWIIFPDRTGL